MSAARSLLGISSGRTDGVPIAADQSASVNRRAPCPRGPHQANEQKKWTKRKQHQRPTDLNRPGSGAQHALGQRSRCAIHRFTYVTTTWKGFAYVALVIDAYACKIISRCASTSAQAGSILDALEQAVRKRLRTKAMWVVRHSDLGSKYLSIRYTERLGEACIVNRINGVPRQQLRQCGGRNHQRPIQG